MESSGRHAHASPTPQRRHRWQLTPKRARNLTALFAALIFMWAPIVIGSDGDSWSLRGGTITSALQRSELAQVIGDRPRAAHGGESEDGEASRDSKPGFPFDDTLREGDIVAGAGPSPADGSQPSSGSGSPAGSGGSGSSGNKASRSGETGSGSGGSGSGGSGSGAGGSGGSGEAKKPRAQAVVGANVQQSLPIHNGDIVVTQAGTVLSGMEIRGRVIIRANNVTIRDCRIVGGAALREDGALVQSWYGNTGLVVKNTEIRAAQPSAYVNGIAGAGFTAENVTISNVVDSVVIIGSNVTVRNSVLGKSYHLASDPRHGGGPSHDDNIQIESGANILIEGNVLSGAQNTAIMVTQNAGKTQSLTIRNNRLSGGGCTVNIDEKGKGTMSAVSVYRNVFGSSRYSCPMRIPNSTASAGSVFSNVLTDGSTASPQLF